MAVQGSLSQEEAHNKILDIINPPQETEAKPEETENAETSGEEETSQETAQEVEAAENQEEEQSAVEESKEEPEGELPTTLNELAEAIEVEPSFLYGLRAKYDLDGETREFTLGEVKDLVQRADRIKAQSEAIEKSRGELETERTKFQESLQTRIAEAQELVSAAEKQLQDEFNDSDLKALRKDDPAEYAARVQELNAKRQSLEEVKAKAREKLEQQQKEAQEGFQKQQAQLVQQEVEALREAIPEWKDQDKAKSETTELVQYLSRLGYDQSDIAGAVDHRLFVMARKAMLYDKGKKSVDVSKKKVKTLPKVIKPGAKKSETDATAQRRKDGLKKLKQTGDVKDAARLILGDIRSQ